MPHFNTQLRLLNKDYAIKGLVVCLQCSMARIFDLWDGSLDQHMVRGSGPMLWSQDGYQAQVPQHRRPISNIGY